MDKTRIMAFADTVYRDMAGAMAIGMGYLGLRTGLFAALNGAGPVSAEVLAERTGLQPRYVEEWLKGMTAAGWLDYDPKSQAFTLPDEHAYLLASEGTDHFMGGLFLAGPALLAQAPGVARAFKEGGGVPFDAFGGEWVEAVDAMNAGTYAQRLTSYWLTQLPDVTARLDAGGKALDVGCGVGRVSRELARAYPEARITGVDPDGDSITRARLASTDFPGVSFVEGTIETLPAGGGYDLATLFDCLHDLSSPEQTLAAIRAQLAPDGVLLIMEPKAGDHLEENLTPMGAMYYGFSLFHCMTQSLASGGPGLGTCMGPGQTVALLKAGGFSRVETLPIRSQTNLFYAARP